MSIDCKYRLILSHIAIAYYPIVTANKKNYKVNVYPTSLLRILQLTSTI